MSITDGQWILDMDVFRSGVRPAISTGLSVTRAGGLGHNKRQKAQSAQALKVIADYTQAEEFAHFGSELAIEAKRTLATGKRISAILTQGPGDTFPLMAQQLMFDIVLNLGDNEELNMDELKKQANEYAAKVKEDKDFDSIRDQLKAACLIEIKGAPEPKAEENAAAPAATDAKAESEDKHEDKPKEAKESKEAKTKEEAKV